MKERNMMQKIELEYQSLKISKKYFYVPAMVTFIIGVAISSIVSDKLVPAGASFFLSFDLLTVTLTSLCAGQIYYTQTLVAVLRQYIMNTRFGGNKG
jgi:hypothetical protein